jgi:hypothetical protein
LHEAHGDHADFDNDGNCDDDCTAVDRICGGNARNCDACSNGDMDDDYDASVNEELQRSSLI